MVVAASGRPFFWQEEKRVMGHGLLFCSVCLGTNCCLAFSQQDPDRRSPPFAGLKRLELAFCPANLFHFPGSITISTFKHT